jgi:hypothetical protein
MKYQVVGYINNQPYIFEIDPKMVKKYRSLLPSEDGPDGSIGKMITPEAAQVAKEKELDVSLDGILGKNKQ